MKKWGCDAFVTFYLNLPVIEAETAEEAKKKFKEMIEAEEFEKDDLDLQEFVINYLSEK